MIPRVGQLAAALALVALTWATPAQAGTFDFELAHFGTTSGGDLDVNGFESFAGDLGLAMHPRFAGPGSTLGGLGMEFGYSISIADIDETAEHWRKPLTSPEGTMLLSHFFVRKGLPYSFEMGGFLTHIHSSNIWAVALELKWSFVEGHKYAPDFGLRTHVNTLLGNRDMVMITTGGDITISKQFGIGGLLQIVPYVGYEFTYIHARSHVLGLFSPGSLNPATFILPTQDILKHRAVLGLRVLGGIADFGFEAGIGDLQTYTFRVGLNL